VVAKRECGFGWNAPGWTALRSRGGGDSLSSVTYHAFAVAIARPRPFVNDDTPVPLATRLVPDRAAAVAFSGAACCS
jgi:hypothetical protein